jgi:hypothetical protein
MGRHVLDGEAVQHVDDAVGVDAAVDLDGEPSRVNSSITFNIFRVRPSAVVSN